jgi:metal-responsive CopG/Arc/MetJ family transcriptional regulator
MPDAPQNEEKRLIILLPTDLLEELRQSAEEEDLSVSQVVRRAIRNELRRIQANKSSHNTITFGELEEVLRKVRTTNSHFPTSLSDLLQELAERKREVEESLRREK